MRRVRVQVILPKPTSLLPLCIIVAPLLFLHSAAIRAGDSDKPFALAAADAGTNLGGAAKVTSAHALHTAALYNRPKAAEFLVGRGVPVDMRNEAGLTPLMVAATFGNVEVADALLTLGADITARNPPGHTSLHIAALAGQSGILRLLLDHGADIAIRARHEGETPLHFAALYGRLKVVELLAARGADIDVKDNQGVTPLQYARLRLQNQAVARLLALGAHEDGLHDAVNAGDVARVVELIAQGADVNAHDLFGTPLHLAAAKGRTGIAVILIDRAADIEAPGEPEGALPLHTAALNGQAQVAALLLDRGAKVDARDAAGRTALMVAAGFLHPHIAKLLLAKGADPNAQDGVWGNMPAHYAACSGDIETMRLLLAAGVDINSAGQGNGSTALHYAANKGAIGMVDFLIRSGAEMNTTDESGWTPLKLASNHRHQDVVEKLEKLGARR
jgi:ankyrin repeat protein